MKKAEREAIAAEHRRKTYISRALLLWLNDNAEKGTAKLKEHYATWDYKGYMLRRVGTFPNDLRIEDVSECWQPLEHVFDKLRILGCPVDEIIEGIESK